MLSLLFLIYFIYFQPLYALLSYFNREKKARFCMETETYFLLRIGKTPLMIFAREFRSVQQRFFFILSASYRLVQFYW